MNAIQRLDHIICTTDDIRRDSDVLQSLGFPVAWPIGPFWPNALTAGIAIGGLNLELVQPQKDPPEKPFVDCLVFEPSSADFAYDSLASFGIHAERFEKIETDHHLLMLRGFDPEAARTPQIICHNTIPPGDLGDSFFFCEYSPHLRQHLHPDNPRLKAPSAVTKIEVECRPAVIDLILSLGTPSNVKLEFRPGDRTRVTAVHFADGVVRLDSLLG